MSVSSFQFEPLFAVAASAAAVAYASHSRMNPPGVARALVFAVGLALVVVPLNSPLETLARGYLLLAHLVQNAMIADWGPPLIILGLTSAARDALAQRAGRPLKVVTNPAVALGIWIGAWYGVHIRLLYDGALRHPAWLNVEHCVLVCAGLVFWWPVFADLPQRLSSAARIAYLIVGSFLAAPLGFALIFLPWPYYTYYLNRPRLWGISPILDQHLGGIFMNVEQSVVFFAALAFLFVRWMEEDGAADTA